MAIGETIRDVLAGDGTLAALLTGGIYSYDETGRNGISRAALPDAFDTDGFLLPCAVVKTGEARAAAAIRDSQSGTRQMVEVYVYNDGDSDYGTITSARELVIGLLDRQWIAGVGFVQRAGGADDLRDPKLNNAALARVDFEVVS
ncbi:MAG: hypothetical protein LC121_26330 [Anaerolineae bacterium]|nr:hypothetical protein [Anaerolineae bacterium]